MNSGYQPLSSVAHRLKVSEPDLMDFEQRRWISFMSSGTTCAELAPGSWMTETSMEGTISPAVPGSCFT